MAKDWNTLHTLPQSEALINEVKGNLFEYLVAFELSRLLGLSSSFIRTFSKIGGGRAQEDLRHYQEWLRENDVDLFNQLPSLARTTSEQLFAKLPALREGKFHNLMVTGKSGAVSGQNSLKECDILIEGEEETIPLSIKFSKRGAYVNTKSGGIRSFLEKYFASFSEATQYQEELNAFLEQSFIQMAQELYAWADIDANHLMGHSGHFSPQWSEANLPELPGLLEERPRKSLFEHYYRVIDKLHFFICEFEKRDRERFLSALAPLMGLSDERLIQVTLYHKNRHHFDSLEIERGEDLLKAREDLFFHPLKKEVSSFSLGLKDKTLQIRVKPMNKFTVSALKVNCSVKTERSN